MTPNPSWTTNDEICFLFGGGCYSARGLVNSTPERLAAARSAVGLPRVTLSTVLADYLANLHTRRWTGCSVDVGVVERALRSWLNANTQGERSAAISASLRARGVIL